MSDGCLGVAGTPALIDLLAQADQALADGDEMRRPESARPARPPGPAYFAAASSFSVKV